MKANVFGKLKKKLFQLNVFRNQESKVCPKKVGLFQFKMGWFKIKAGTNLGSQNYIYLSALNSQLSVQFLLILLTTVLEIFLLILLATVVEMDLNTASRLSAWKKFLSLKLRSLHTQ